MNEKRIVEEITRQELRSIINSRIEEYMKEKEFEKRVRELSTDALEKFFRLMWNKRGFWKSDLKNV